MRKDKPVVSYILQKARELNNRTSLLGYISFDGVNRFFIRL